jgi:hypothetical protein
MAAALLLHPRLRDAVPLTPESKKNACKFVYNYILQTQEDSPNRWKTADAVTATMHAYIMRDDQFAEPGPAQGQSEAAWWQERFAGGYPAGDAMMEVVERLHSIPPHTAAVERFYSRLSFMHRPHRSNLSMELLVDMAMVNTWLVVTDPEFGKPPPAASKQPEAHAGSDEQEHASTDSRNDDSDDDEDVVLCGEDNPADADADDAAMTATNGDSESLLRAESASMAPPAPEKSTSKERVAGRVVESRFMLARGAYDLKSPFLLAGIHGSSVAQKTPIKGALKSSSEDDDGAKTAKGNQRIDGWSFNG